MTYVPITPAMMVQPPSPRTRELADLLARVMEEYAKAHPTTTNGEVRDALRLAEARVGGVSAGPRQVIVVLVGVVIALVVGSLFFVLRAG